MPDLLLIDGGQPQLSAALSVLGPMGIEIPAIGLAKREEEIWRRLPDGRFEAILLPPASHVLQLLQRVRDEAHRFAINYQTLLRGKRSTVSLLDAIPGIGPATRKTLVRRFGSVRGVKLATLEEVAIAIGPAKATVVKEHLGQSVEPAPSSSLDAPVPDNLEA
jgi:excinuclease ABC subunit C